MSSANQLNIIPVPAFRDNYLWLFHAANGRQAYIVDPGDAGPVLRALEDRDLELAGIVITHHHPDHTGGIDRLLSRYSVPVYGPAGGSVPQVTEPLTDGGNITLGLLPEWELTFEIISVPGHTLDHIAYYAEPVDDDPVLFCGDTLFAGGCGRLFEGTAEQMHVSLSRLAQLPGATRVYCAHEYTLANLAFAKAVEPRNAELLKRIEVDQARRQRDIPTVPSTIALELSTNPFMRSGETAVKQAAENRARRTLGSPSEVLATVRQWKDNF